MKRFLKLWFKNLGIFLGIIVGCIILGNLFIFCTMFHPMFTITGCVIASATAFTVLDMSRK